MKDSLGCFYEVKHMAVKRKCVCCGKEYDYCPNCAKKDQPAWMVTFCNETCKELFNVVSAYNMKRLGKEKVQAFIAEHNITDSHYSEPIEKVLREVGTTPTVEKFSYEEPKLSGSSADEEYRSNRRSRRKRHKFFGY